MFERFCLARATTRVASSRFSFTRSTMRDFVPVFFWIGNHQRIRALVLLLGAVQQLSLELEMSVQLSRRDAALERVMQHDSLVVPALRRGSHCQEEFNGAGEMDTAAPPSLLVQESVFKRERLLPENIGLCCSKGKQLSAAQRSHRLSGGREGSPQDSHRWCGRSTASARSSR